MIEVYTAENCSKCKMVVKYLCQLDAPFIELPAADYLDKLAQLNATQLPVVMEKDTIVCQGFDRLALQKVAQNIG